MHIKNEQLCIPIKQINTARIKKYPYRLEMFISGQRKVIIRCDSYNEADSILNQLIKSNQEDS